MIYLFDFKFALRYMLQKPGFAALTMGIMTIGLGLCVFNYSFIHGLMFKDLPFENGNRMYVINTVENGVEYNGGSIRIPDYREIRDNLKGVEQIGAYYGSTVDLSGSGNTIRRRGIFTQSNMFEFTNVAPLMGRTLNEQDNQTGANPVVVIGYDLWQSYFGAKPDIVGEFAYIDGNRTEIVGVMPQGYLFPSTINLWLPMQVDIENAERSLRIATEVFILRDKETSIGQINAQLKTIMGRLAQQYPDSNDGISAMAKNFRMSQIGNGGMIITYSMLGAVFLIMLLACTNVGNLLLARATERAKETAVRVALGAPRGRLIMQMMWESLIICSVGGLLAILLAGWGLEITEGVMGSIFNGPMPFFWRFELDTHILGFTLIAVVITAFVTGLLPALKISGGDFNSVLRDGTRGAQSRGSSRIGKILVILEITLSCALLTTAAALGVGTHMVNQADYGIDVSNKMTAIVELPLSRYPEQGAQTQFFMDLTDALKAQPQVADASLAGNLPGKYTGFTPIAIEGYEKTESNAYPKANATNLMPGLLEVVDVQPIAGRLFDRQDTADKPRVAVVTESFANQHFASPNDAIGKRYRFAEDTEITWYTIIGVVPHIIYGQPYEDLKTRPAVMTSTLQDTHRFMRMVVKPSGTLSSQTLEPVIRGVVNSLDKDLAPYRFQTYQAEIERNTAGMNFLSSVFNLFALAAIILAATGIYGVMANTIERRTQELGIRRALGAPDQSVLNMLLKQGLWQLLLGAAIGAPLAYLLGNQMVAMLGVESVLIQVTFVAMPVFIGIVVMLSTYLPTLKAIRLEPAAALRYE